MAPIAPPHRIERHGRAAIVHVEGDVVVPTARLLYSRLRGLVRGRRVREIVLDFEHAGRVDSSGVAVVSLFARQARRAGKRVDVTALGDQHRAVFDLEPGATQLEDVVPPSRLERIGGAVLDTAAGARAFARLVAELGRQGIAVVFRGRRLPAGALVDQVAIMGADAVFIVGLLSFLLGMTMAFQGAVQLQRFGAGPFVADMVSVSMVRELAPLMTAVLLAGRTGAAIAAELATMHMRSEIDALATMGIEPVRFLIVPRMTAITLVGPALSLLAMFLGIVGGMVVASATMSMPMTAFWHRVVDRVELADFAHGLAKSVAFAWIVGLAGSHLGLRAGRDASSVGAAATRTVVAAIFFIIVVDALFATIATIASRS